LVAERNDRLRFRQDGGDARDVARELGRGVAGEDDDGRRRLLVADAIEQRLMRGVQRAGEVRIDEDDRVLLRRDPVVRRGRVDGDVDTPSGRRQIVAERSGDEIVIVDQQNRPSAWGDGTAGH